MMLRIDELSEVFEDTEPVPQDDGPLPPVCAIQYPTAFRLAYDYMRAVWKSGEFSDRTLKLSATCLKLNPANYTVWHYRRKNLRALGRAGDLTTIQADLTLSSQLGGSNPKNYQVWYHRRALLEAYHEAHSVGALAEAFLSDELTYIGGVLQEDSKNYHAWSYRQWLVRTINQEALWEEDLASCRKLIEKDPRNNSAWNERWFASHRAQSEKLSLQDCKREADLSIEIASWDPYNESPLRYLVGLLKEQASHTLYEEYLTALEGLREVLEKAGRDPESCANWSSARVDLLEALGDASSLAKAADLVQGLGETHDPIRAKYWRMRGEAIAEKRQSVAS